ncbi:hypothetical protein EVAR_22370_1 [Eumeta japonica]|uniref:Uncharacterized protein n=1 Tax=Eumeta variegata TaxID=151549 RepID=A0A4C1VJM3_EUMVA|nr:hypothetical protein EVAR_22370_1 [Eumeta japonica]
MVVSSSGPHRHREVLGARVLRLELIKFREGTEPFRNEYGYSIRRAAAPVVRSNNRYTCIANPALRLGKHCRYMKNCRLPPNRKSLVLSAEGARARGRGEAVAALRRRLFGR